MTLWQSVRIGGGFLEGSLWVSDGSRMSRYVGIRAWGRGICSAGLGKPPQHGPTAFGTTDDRILGGRPRWRRLRIRKRLLLRLNGRTAVEWGHQGNGGHPRRQGLLAVRL